MITLSSLTRLLVQLKDTLRRYEGIQPDFNRKHNLRHSIPITEMIELTELAAVTCGQGDWYPKTFGELGMDAEFILAGRRCIKLGAEVALVIGKFRRVVTADTRVMARDAAQDAFASGLIDTLAKTMDVPRRTVGTDHMVYGYPHAVNPIRGEVAAELIGGDTDGTGYDALARLPLVAKIFKAAEQEEQIRAEAKAAGLVPVTFGTLARTQEFYAYGNHFRRVSVHQAEHLDGTEFVWHFVPEDVVYVEASRAPVARSFKDEMTSTAVGVDALCAPVPSIALPPAHERHFSDLKVGQQFACGGRPYVKVPATFGARLLDKGEGPGIHIHYFDPLQVVELVPPIEKHDGGPCHD